MIKVIIQKTQGKLLSPKKNIKTSDCMTQYC